MQVIKCAICTQTVPVQLKNSHHERPQAAGGGPDDEVDLCVACHQNLHTLANLLRRNKGSEAEDIAKVSYPNPAIRERLFKFAWLVVEWMSLKADGQIKLDDDVPIVVMVPAEVRLALNQMAGEIRQNGRKMGVARFCSELIKHKVYKKFPSLRKQPDERKPAKPWSSVKRPGLPRPKATRTGATRRGGKRRD